MVELLISAFVLGLVGGVIPGPVIAAIFTEILEHGFGKALRIVLWGMLTETAVALCTLIAVASFQLTEGFFRAISFIGAFVLIHIAFGIWKVKSLTTGERTHFSPRKISAMILANGELWIFWITVCVPKAIALNGEMSFGQYVFLGVVEIGWLLSTLAVALAFTAFRRILSNPTFIPFLFKFFALVFIYFAGSMLFGSVMFFAGR